ncbi:MAG: hypothetical protein KDC57_14970 [Saprospiraceae bacterium]|nr:hypothetical protein [Saprospiraceae bacterium]
MTQQYLVTFHIDQPVDGIFTSKIPHQRLIVDQLLQSGKMLMYSLTKDMSTLYIVFQVESTEQLGTLIDTLPLSEYMTWDYQELFFHLSTVVLPEISLN